MPGIAGVFSTTSSTACQPLARQMVAAMRHRADDVHGTIDLPELGVSAGWVAHAGSYAARLSATEQPGAPRLLWSGECFGADGTGTPEVALTSRDAPLALYEGQGESFVTRLNGLFSGLLLDARRGIALLFNDRYGSERLYLHEKDGMTFFASEAKALLAALPELRSFDEQGVADFLTFGSTLQGRTLFRGLRTLPGGSLWRFSRDAAPEATRYFTPREWEQQEPLDAEGFERALSGTFARIMQGYAHSDRALGISLTGGLDTRMIMACLPDLTPAPACYTYAAMHGDTLDVSIGRRVAAVRGLSHQSLRLPQAFLTDFGHFVDRTVHVTDGCAGALVAHEIPLSEQARAIAPVRMTGNFGSEVLRSMSTFKPVGMDFGLVDPAWNGALAQAAQRVAHDPAHPVTHAAFEEIPWHLSGSLQAGRSQLTVRTPFLDNEIVALAYRAPAHLRHSAHASLRLIHEHAPALAQIATDRGIAWQKPAWRSLPMRLFCAVTFKLDYWHKEGLPTALSHTDPLFSLLDAAGLLGLHKFLPYRRWFRHELAPYLAEVVNDSRTRNMPFWNKRFLDTVVDDHVKGRANRLRELHAILTLEAVDRLLIGTSTPARAPGQSA